MRREHHGARGSCVGLGGEAAPPVFLGCVGCAARLMGVVVVVVCEAAGAVAVGVLLGRPCVNVDADDDGDEEGDEEETKTEDAAAPDVAVVGGRVAVVFRPNANQPTTPATTTKNAPTSAAIRQGVLT